VHPRIGLQRDAGKGDRTRRNLVGAGIGVMGADDCDFVTTPTQFLIQEPCLKRCTVGVGYPNEIAQDRHAQRPPQTGRQGREGGKVGRGRRGVQTPVSGRKTLPTGPRRGVRRVLDGVSGSRGS
jgi:hypothetical protein